MDNKEKLAKLLLVDFGVDLYPKADGRVEIPKHIVSYAWDSNLVYISSDMCGNIFISDDAEQIQEEISVSVRVSHGRVRIPSGFLRKVGMYRRNLIATFDGISIVHIKQNNASGYGALLEFLNSLSDCQADQFVKIMTGRAPRDDNNIPDMEIVRISANQGVVSEPKLFLLVSDENKPVLFRPIGDPYKFKCCWVDGVPKLTQNDDTNNTSVIYAIPGIKRNKDEGNAAGFLLIDSITFGKVRYVANRRGSTVVGRVLIFLFSPKARVGSFKVFENPEEKMDPNSIEEAKLICSNPERFLYNNFDLFASGSRGQTPLTITANTMKKDQGV